MDQGYRDDAYDRLQEACELQEQLESQRVMDESMDLDLGLGGLGISQYDLSMEDFGSLSGLLQEGTVLLTPDSPDEETASSNPATPEGADSIQAVNGSVPLLTHAPMLDFDVLTEDEPSPSVDGLLDAIGDLELTHINIVENKASTVLPVEPALDSPRSPPQTESSPIPADEATSPSNEPLIIEWRLIIPPDAMPSLAQQHAASVQPAQPAQSPQPNAEPAVATQTGEPQTMAGMQGVPLPDPYDRVAFPADMVSRMPPPVANDLSLENMLRAAALRQQSRTASASEVTAAPQQPSAGASATVPRQNVIPVVAYSRDQLTVIPSGDEPQTSANEPKIQAQSGMSCAQYLSTFDVDSDDDEEPTIEKPVATENSPTTQIVQINNGYVLPANGQNRVFPVQEMYIVTNSSSASTSPSSSPASSSGEYSPGWEDPQEGTSQAPQVKTRKRQRRTGIDYNTNFICQPCGKTFGKKGSLEQHKRQHHSAPRPWICETCGKSFETSAKLVQHVANHNPENKRFPCEECGRRYVHRKDRDRHFLTHHGNPNWPCQECSKTFVRRDHLLAHIVSHRRRERRILAKLAKLTREQQKNQPGGNPPPTPPPEGPAQQAPDINT